MQIKTKIVSSQTADSKPVKQEVNGTVILPPLVFPDMLQGSTGYKFIILFFFVFLVEKGYPICACKLSDIMRSICVGFDFTHKH